MLEIVPIGRRMDSGSKQTLHGWEQECVLGALRGSVKSSQSNGI